MVISAFEGQGLQTLVVVWRFATTMHGALCVMTSGTTLMLSPATTSRLSLVYVCQPMITSCRQRYSVSKLGCYLHALTNTFFYYASSDICITISPWLLVQCKYYWSHVGKQNPMFDLLTAKESNGCVSGDWCLRKLKRLQLILSLVSLFMHVPWP